MVGAIGSRPQLVAKKVLEDELILIVPPQNHRWPSGSIVTVHDLTEEDFILREQGSGTRQVFAERLKEQGVGREGFACGDGAGKHRSYSHRGGSSSGGISVVSRWAADKALALGQVRGINVEGLNLKRDLFVIIHRQTLPTGPWRSFRAL